MLESYRMLLVVQGSCSVLHDDWFKQGNRMLLGKRC